MKKYLYFIFLFLFCQLSKAQVNLVQNSDFNEIHFIQPTGSPIEFAKNWWAVGGTPDYFCRSCTTQAMFSIPNTYAGFQEPKKGDAFIGLLTYPIREYIQTEMKEALIKGKKYCVSFSVNHPDYMYYATDMIGIYFSKDTLFNNSVFDFSLIEITPNISNAQGNIITDTINWIDIKGYFWAEGDERFLTLGNFYPNFLLNIDSSNYSNTIFMFSYYFIDDVSVYECEEAPTNTITFTNAFTPNGDGVNDVFRLQGQNIKTINGKILNRWGQELYNWSEISSGWDGTYKGKEAAKGTYFYVVTVGFEDGETKNYTGSILLSR